MSHPLLRLLTIVGLFCLPALAHAQSRVPSPGTIGLSASLQAAQFDVFVPIWVSDRFVVAPAIGIAWVEGMSTSIAIGVAPRLYVNTDPVGAYVGVRAGVLLTSPDEGSSTTDIVVGGTFGGEYFLSSSFSLGVESQLNLTISDKESTRFGNPGRMNLNTGAAAYATIYF